MKFGRKECGGPKSDLTSAKNLYAGITIICIQLVLYDGFFVIILIVFYFVFRYNISGQIKQLTRLLNNYYINNIIACGLETFHLDRP